MRLPWLWRLWAGGLFAIFLLQVGSVRADPSTTADDREARKLFEAGAAAYDAGQYERALENFEKAYELSPRPVLLYNIAKSEDQLDRKREAREHYKRFLAAVPDAQNRRQVELRIEELDVDIAREPPPPEVPTPEEAARASETPPEATPLPAQPERSERIHKKWWFWTGIGAIVAGGVVAGVMLGTRGNGSEKSDPLLLDDMTRVREL